MATRMQQRRGTASQWTIADPVLAAGEIGVESDTAKFKIGDGINTWSTLDYFSATPDLTGYATEAYADQAEADAISTAASDATTKANTAESNANSYTDTAISNLVDSAPGTLDTLNELAAALNDDANFSATITNSIASKQADVITTAGDLVVGDVNGDASRLAIGTDGQTLAVENGAITWKDSGSNNFVVEMSGSNNTVQLDSTKAAGTYNISLASGDTTFDIYLVAPDGSEAGYSNSGSITATADFDTVVALGAASDEVVAFSFAGAVSTADGVGDEPGAAAYLTSISPTDLPTIDDTATVTGGNFGADTEIKFESGATVLDAKNIVVTNSTSLVVTRPDNLDADLDPWTLRAITTGVPEPTGTNANILTDAVTAGDSPVWVTTSPLATATINTSYTDTLEATDPDGGAVTYAVTTGSLPTGLSLDSSTGVISGTPTGSGQTFTVTATDDGGSQTTREFTLPVLLATGGTVTSAGGFVYHTFTSSDDFVALTTITDAEYVLIGGGGGASQDRFGAGGGAGGVLQGTVTLTAQTYSVGIGDGGAGDNTPISGTGSNFGNIASAVGGGAAGGSLQPGQNGGSGGGGYASGNDAALRIGGNGTAGQGFDGGNALYSSNAGFAGGGGGGATEAGSDAGNIGSNPGNGGDGIQLSDWASATGTGLNNYYAGGGGAGGAFGNSNYVGSPGAGATNGTAQENTGSGGSTSRGDGGSGLLMVRY